MPEIDLPDQKVGDVWAVGGGVFGPCTVEGGGPLPFVVTSCRLQFRKRGKLIYEMNNAPDAGEGLITIVDGVTWHFTFFEMILPLSKGTHTWEFEVKGAGATDVLTPYSGKITMVEDHCFG